MSRSSRGSGGARLLAERPHIHVETGPVPSGVRFHVRRSSQLDAAKQRLAAVAEEALAGVLASEATQRNATTPRGKCAGYS